jgi:hypothetical protein
MIGRRLIPLGEREPIQPPEPERQLANRLSWPRIPVCLPPKRSAAVLNRPGSQSSPRTRRPGRTWTLSSALSGATGTVATASVSRSETPTGARWTTRNAPTGCASRPPAVSPRRAQRAASSPTSTESPPAGARSSRASPTCACCGPASPGRAERKTRPTIASGPRPASSPVQAFGAAVSAARWRAAVDFARQRGARALKGYPMITQPGQEVTWGELHVGSRSIFAAAGFVEVSRPTLRRVVMRIDF